MADDEEQPYIIIDNKLEQYLILTGYFLHEGNKLEDISSESLANLKELIELELVQREEVFH